MASLNFNKKVPDCINGIILEALTPTDKSKLSGYELLSSFREEINKDVFFNNMNSSDLLELILIQLDATRHIKKSDCFFTINININILLSKKNIVEIINHVISKDNIILEIQDPIELKNKSKVELFLINNSLNVLFKAGFTIWVDDINSDNFKYILFLQNFQGVKIDKYFFWASDSDMNNKNDLLSLISEVKKMGKKVIIEGIETDKQFNECKKLDIDYMQGYFWEKAIYDLR